MSLLRRAVFMAAKRAASDPHIQAQASRFAEEEVVPQLRAAADRVRPAIDEARGRARQAADALRETAREYPPADDPRGLLNAAGRRFGRTG